MMRHTDAMRMGLALAGLLFCMTSAAQALSVHKARHSMATTPNPVLERAQQRARAIQPGTTSSSDASHRAANARRRHRHIGKHIPQGGPK